MTKHHPCVMILFLLLAVSLPGVLSAQNLRGLPMGARSASLGQTGVAGPATDGSAYINPAALTDLDGDQFSLSTMVLSTGYTPLESEFDPEKWTKTEGSLDHSMTYMLPTSISYAIAWGKNLRLALAGSVIIPLYQINRVTDSNSYDSVSGNSFWRRGGYDERKLKRMLIGPSIALGWPHLRLRVGVSLFVSITEMSRNTWLKGSAVKRGGGLYENYLLEIVDSLRTVGGCGILGIQWIPIESLTLGLSFKSGLFTFDGSGYFRSNYRSSDVDQSGSNIAEATSSDVRTPDPPELRIGATFRLGSRLELRADLLYTFSLGVFELGHSSSTINRMISGEPQSFQKFELTRRMTTTGAINASVGVGIALGERWWLNLGFLTDRSSSGERPGPNETGTIRWPKIDRYLITTGVSYLNGFFSLHSGLAAGPTFYESRDFHTNGKEEISTGFALRLFLAGGISAEDILAVL